MRSVAIYLPDLRIGGAERVAINLARFFLSHENEVTFVLTQHAGELLEAIPVGAKMVQLGANRTIGSLPKLISYLKNERPSILLSSIDCNSIIAILAGLIARTKTKIIICQHIAPLCDSATAVSWQQKLVPLLYRICWKWADHFVSVSHGIAKELQQVTGMDKSSISVIYNPVLEDNFEQLAQEAIAHPWLVDNGIPVFVSVGRLVEVKDLPTLLQAFKALNSRTESRLIIIGDGPLRAKLVNMAEELGIAANVAFIGYQKNPLAFIARARALVLCSRLEGLPTVLIEAMACGTPVISTDCRYGPAEILEGGKYGRLVPVGDWQALAEAMFAIADTRYKIQDLVLKERVHQFRAHIAGQQYLELFARMGT